MELKKLDHALSICKVASEADIDLSKDFYFIGKTDEEFSVVCITGDVPANATDRDDGWRGFRIQGVLDFSMLGVLSRLSGLLAESKIPIFVVSTFNTDYILVKETDFARSLQLLANSGYEVS